MVHFWRIHPPASCTIILCRQLLLNIVSVLSVSEFSDEYDAEDLLKLAMAGKSESCRRGTDCQVLESCLQSRRRDGTADVSGCKEGHRV